MMADRIRIVLLLYLLCFSPLSGAKDQGQYLLSEKTYKALTDAQALMSAEQYSKAEVALLALLKRTQAGSYEQAIVQQTLGYVYSAKSQYRQARTQFQQALASGALPDPVSHSLRYNLGQLLLAEEQYQAGINTLEKWFSNEPAPPNSAHVLIASAYYQLDQFNQVVKHMKIALRNESKPSENWYQLLLAAHLELKQYSASISILEKLIVRYPKKAQYWQQLAALYAQLNKQTTALAVQVLAQRLDLSDGEVVVRLADMYRYLQIPYKSAQLLTKGMRDGDIVENQRNLNRLADSWLAAREKEKAAVILARLAKRDASGEAGVKYGRVLFDLAQWQDASSAFEISLQKLVGKRRGTAYLMAGLSQFHLDRFEQAQTLLMKAAKFKNEKQQALYWLSYIDQVLQNKTVNSD